MMTSNKSCIIDDIISIIDFNAPVRDIRQGLFHTAVMTRHCGLAATLPRDALRQAHPAVKEPGLLMEKSARELAVMVHSESIPEAAIGMATVNSLLDIDESMCRELNAREILIEKGRDKNVAMIGHFPFIDVLRKQVKQLWVIEKNQNDDDLPESAAAQYLPEADVVAMTGTSFTNHTIEELLGLCNPDAYIVMLGDTVPLTPVLFDYGIDAVSGTKVVEAEQALRCVSQGATYRQIKGIRQLTLIK